jgi:hypothetical protein
MVWGIIKKKKKKVLVEMRFFYDHASGVSGVPVK